MADEAKIVINNQVLTEAQSATVRVALESFAQELQTDGLGSDEHGKTMTKLYLERISEIRKPLYQELFHSRKKA
ncbi:hypothetical protein ACRWQL_00445 (plasmid) [Shewanella sp. HL-SH4]|uniref:hypothetical protein n=1 Tax=Shewanella sp. HL-SH4 TaxID=3436240 RepID=UPI003EB87057